MAPGTREKTRKVATPKPASKTATSTKAKASESAKPRRAKNVTDNDDNEDAVSSPEKSRKRAADYFEGHGDEHAGPSTDKKTEKPQKKAKTSAPHNVKPSKDDGHPVETAKTFPGGDMVEMDPEEVEHIKPEKPNKAKDTKPIKARKASSAKNQEVAKVPSKKSKAKKDDEPLEEVVDVADTNEGTITRQTSKGSKRAVSSKAIDDSPAEMVLGIEVDEAPVALEIQVVVEAATTGKKKSAPNAKGAKKTIDPTEVTTGPTEGPSKKNGLKSADKISANTKSDKKPRASKKDDISIEKARTNGNTEGALEEESSKTRKRKAPADVDSDAIKSKLLGPIAEAASSKKKQKKSEAKISEKASGTVGSLLNSGKEAAMHGMTAAKNLLNDIAGGAEDSLMGDITGTASDAVDVKIDEKQKPTKSIKKSKGKAKDDNPPPADDEFEGLDREDASDLVSGQEDDGKEDDQTAALLKGFESDEDDDDEPPNDMGFETGQEVPGLPDKRGLSAKLKKAMGNEDKGVVYIGRIPHGFHEHEMRSYFAQFGTVNHVRLSRSKKTGNSKHYAFLEFASAEVAQIVANTMDNYLMFGHILKCKLVPKEQVHQSLWKGADRRFKKVPWNKIEGRKLEVPVGRDVWEKRVETERKRREKKAEQTKAIGYEFEGMGLKAVQDLPVKETKAIESSDETVEQEKTLVVDAGDGAMVVSEEVKTKKIKKGKKSKTGDNEGFVETVKALVGKGAEIVRESLGEVGGLTKDAGTTTKDSVSNTAENIVEATPEITKGVKKFAKKAKGKAAAATEKTTAVANDTVEQAMESDIASKVAEKSAESKDLAATAVENAMRAVRDTVNSATDTANQLGDKDFSGQAADTVQQAKDASGPVVEKARGAAHNVSSTAENLVDSTKKATKKGKSKTAPLLENAKETAQTSIENSKQASGPVLETATGVAENVAALANDSVAATKTAVKKGKAKAAPVVEGSKGVAQGITENVGRVAKKGTKAATTNKNGEEVGVAKKASELASAAVEKASEVASGVADKASKVASGAADKASEVASEVTQTATDAKNAAPGLAEEAFEAAKGAAETVADSVMTGAQGLAHHAESVATTTTEQAGKAVRGAKKGARKAADSAAELADAVTEAAKDAAHRAEPTAAAIAETADSVVKNGKKAAKNAKDTTAQFSKDTVETISSTAQGVIEKAGPIANVVTEQASNGIESTKATASAAMDVLPAVGKTITTTTGDAVAIAQDAGTDVVQKVSGKGRKRKSEAADISEEIVDVVEQGTIGHIEMTGMTEEVTTEVIEELTIQETEDTEKVTKKTKRFSKKELKPTITEEVGEGSSERKVKRSRKST
ncbi:hypothetical protein MMC27_007813 [Xylographa pallens]|nr:hypothetical protein [Xylographa pallens]